MGQVAEPLDTSPAAGLDFERSRVRLLFYLGVPALTALLFSFNQAGMARLLPTYWAIPYWLGITIPLWALLDGCSRGVHLIFRAYAPHRWLVLLGGSLAAMALFSPYLTVYAEFFASRLLDGVPYRVTTPFPEAFLDLRRFAAYSSVPIYWIAITLFFARYFGFPPYLALQRAPVNPAPVEPQLVEPQPVETTNSFGLPVRIGFRALLPYHLGTEIVSLSAEDHYVRVVTDRGNALIRYRFGDALKEVSIPGIQAHRSHWVAVQAIERVRAEGKSYRLTMRDGSEIPVSRTNVGVLRSAGLI